METLTGVTDEKFGWSNLVSIHRYCSRTLVIDVHFNFDWAVKFLFCTFPFPPGTERCVSGIKKT